MRKSDISYVLVGSVPRCLVDICATAALLLFPTRQRIESTRSKSLASLQPHIWAHLQQNNYKYDIFGHLCVDFLGQMRPILPKQVGAVHSLAIYYPIVQVLHLRTCSQCAHSRRSDDRNTDRVQAAARSRHRQSYPSKQSPTKERALSFDHEHHHYYYRIIIIDLRTNSLLLSHRQERNRLQHVNKSRIAIGVYLSSRNN